MEETQERCLLLVDDEENILRSLRRLFRRQGYHILTANSGRMGLEVLKENNVGVIISDQRMPEMTGSEFLHRVKDIYPDTVRIILSGYTDLESVTNSINLGAIYKFLTKPWDDELLCNNVEEAFRIYELNTENQRLSEELKKNNQMLETRVEEKTAELRFNLKTLQISQSILEELPIAVLGISDDQIIVTNRRARELYSQNPVLLGMEISEACSPQLLELYQKASATKTTQTLEMEHNGELFIAQCQQNPSGGSHYGAILTLRSLS